MYDYFLKKYWSTGQFIILGYEKPNYKSDLIEFVSLGEDLGPNKLNEQLYNYFLKLGESQFIFTVDDMPILKPVDVDLINYTEDLLKANANIGRVGISEDNSSRSHRVIDKLDTPDNVILLENMSVADTCNYKLSATWSAWNLEYFLLYLNKYENLWDWEYNGSIQSNKDDFKVMGFKPSPLLHSHLIKSSKWIKTWNKGCSHYYDFDMKSEDQLKVRSIYEL
jgi:hypothetical protein